MSVWNGKKRTGRGRQDGPAGVRALPWRELRRALWVPAYIACFAMMEFLPPRTYWATQLPVDDWIPFCSWFLGSVLLWMFFPNGQDLRPAAPDGVFGPLVAMIYRIDTNTNVFPSIHVVGAVGAALAVRDAVGRRNRGVYTGVSLLAALICLSTVFLKQHSVLDVAGGLAFSAAAGIPIYIRPAWLRRLRHRLRTWGRPRRLKAG